MSTPEPELPTLERLNVSRQQRWHQQGEALLTFENLRSWINASGLVLFTPRPQQLPAPAPSMVEAVLGAANANPSLAETAEARSLLARLIAEGIAVPLNLLGIPGDTPDFVASAAVFAYVFTLRGDKGWKQPPATSGAAKVSPLALATHALLAEHGPKSAYDLATQLGKEITESAVLRALTELWSHLRVLPLLQPDGEATLWELAGTRFTKLIKAGANAGQPSALSALISLYLNSTMVATEDEIETFLSPLAARSRIRDVVHALLGARELETIAIEGKTVVYVAGEAPEFVAPVVEVDAAAEAPAEETIEVALAEADGDAPRITKFVAKPRKTGTGFPKKFAAKPVSGTRPAFSRDRERPTDRERRPFDRSSRPAAGKPDFTKPWQEDRPARPAAEGGEGEQARPRFDRPKPQFDRGARPAFGDRPKPRFDRGDRPAFGDRAKPRFDRGDRPSFGDRAKPRFDRGDRPAFGDRPKPRFERTGDRPSFGDRPNRGSRPEGRGFAPKRFEGGTGRPPRREGSEDRPFRSRSFDRQAGERRPFTPREGGSQDRPFTPRGPKTFGDRPQGRFTGERKPFAPREGGTGRPPRREGSSDRPFRRFDAPHGDRPARPFRSEGDRPSRPFRSEGDRPSRPFRSEGGRPGAKFAGKKPFGGAAGKPGAKSTGGPFDKFKGNAKPFGKRPPARKFKPEKGAAGE
ncbi:MAG TPA: hypothetical protein VGC07_01705 [Granulicella sp.]